ncbi:TetR/AcrR family transcriptional regulator [Inconstantimicrobium porci]|uniref:Helix-turn-helix transcriptional regulator n=1 Tax=Inconstantimicrobium porci TaxID=2652291 RepID=A0A7X2T1Y5_9CLOT|nr:helix-turn-helix domain-containing protein [Inconstantimicrobium porci]MSR92102.1 helix-turn-helix transcriptional regulator [Inconstantimicrobium porci]
MRENKIRNERKSEIMDYAMKLFAESGYENTTIEHIAEGLDMDVELCYKYFESK